jgi:signal transduction histidine kinase
MAGNGPEQITNESWLANEFLRQCPACLWIVNREGAFHQIYGDAVVLFGRKAEELLGQPARTGLDEARGDAWSRRFARVLAGETLMIRERLANSTWYVTLFPIRFEDAIVYAGGMAREVTPWSTAEQELRHTVLGAIKTQEFERKMMAQFLHDTVGQNLTALGLQIDLIRMDLGSLTDARKRLGEIQETIGIMMEEVRDYSYELNPSTVERAGLRPALDRLAARIRPRFAGALRINADPKMRLDPKVATALYHIAQEAVQNAVQHASCSIIEIAAKSSRSGPVLEIKNNGRPFDPGDILRGRRGLGLLSMEHYAAQAGLQLTITSNRENGTVVRAAKTDAV